MIYPVKMVGKEFYAKASDEEAAKYLHVFYHLKADQKGVVVAFLSGNDVFVVS